MSKLCIGLFLFLGFTSYAQFETEDKTIYLSYSNIMSSDDGFQQIDFRYDYQVFERMTIGYSFGVGKRQSMDDIYYHLPGGPIITGALWGPMIGLIDNLSVEGLGLALAGSVIVCLIPDRVSFDFFNKSRHLKMSPFLNGLSFDRFDQLGGVFGKLFYRIGAGIDINYLDKSNRFTMGGSISYQHIVAIGEGLNMNVNLGYLLNSKPQKSSSQFDRLELDYD